MVALKTLALWLLILALAIVNGGFREAVLLKVLPRSTAFTVSGLLLMAYVLIVALLCIKWLGQLSLAQYVGVGLLWLALTLAFEFGFGLLVRGESLASLLDAYRFREGNMWPIVLAVVAVAPAFAAYIRGLAEFGSPK
jgi:hypothetical protein